MKFQLTVWTVAATVLFLSSATAEQQGQHKSENCVTQSVTVFQDVSAMNRRKGAGKNLTELNQKYEAMGYSFDDLEIYIEDGDLEGFFVTYTITICQADEETAQ